MQSNNQQQQASDSLPQHWVSASSKTGEFQRQTSSFREHISRKPGARYPPAPNRYHLIVSYACPWAQRTLVVRRLKGLDRGGLIGVTAVHWHMGSEGWRFATEEELEEEKKTGRAAKTRNLRRQMTVHGSVVADKKEWTEEEDDSLQSGTWEGMDAEGLDTLMPGMPRGVKLLRDVYRSVNPEYKDRCTVPVLWDSQERQIVNNESSEIIRMFYTEFDDLIEPEFRNTILLPDDLKDKIEETNEWTYNTINNGVYKAGFAATGTAYAKAVVALFLALDRAEAHLAAAASSGPFYFGERLTESDIRLYSTIVRFDPVYVQHFKCNLRDIRSGYPHIHRWLRHLYWKVPAFRDTTDFVHIKNHYSRSHPLVNHFGITPLGPVPDILPLEDEVCAVTAASKTT